MTFINYAKMPKVVLVTEVWCRGTSFPAFLFNLNPAVVISFKNTDDNHFVGIHEKRYLIFLLLILYSYYCYYKIIFSFNQT